MNEIPPLDRGGAHRAASPASWLMRACCSASRNLRKARSGCIAAGALLGAAIGLVGVARHGAIAALQ